MREARPVRLIIAEALREIGILQIAFAPMDGALGNTPHAVMLAVFFLGIGATLFAVGLWKGR